jgi:hypothetical protein
MWLPLSSRKVISKFFQEEKIGSALSMSLFRRESFDRLVTGMLASERDCSHTCRIPVMGEVGEHVCGQRTYKGTGALSTSYSVPCRNIE